MIPTLANRRGSRWRESGPWAFLALSVAILAAPVPLAAAPRQSPTRVADADPLERLNRGLYAINRGLDRAVFRPLAMAYRRWTPRPVREGVHNVLANLSEPVVTANDLLQLRVAPAGHSAARFVGNTTVGLLGVFDVAAHWGLAHHDNDFGLTLARVGVGSGPYLFVPGLGPMTLRGLVGSGVDLLIDPLNQVPQISTRQLVVGEVVGAAIDGRVEADKDLAEIDATATDPYATVRSLYLQQLAQRVNGGDDMLFDSVPDFADGSSAAGAAAAAVEPVLTPGADTVSPVPAP